MRINVSMAVLGLLILGSVTPAFAATQVITDENVFKSGLQSGYYLEEFDSPPWTSFQFIASPQSFSQGVWAYSLSAPGWLFGIPMSGPGGAVSTYLSRDPITITFNGQYPTAVGGLFWPTDSPGNPVYGQITFSFQGGGSYTYTQTYGAFEGFFIADSPILSMTVASQGSPPQWPTMDHFYVGNVVPEPLTMISGFLALGGIGMYVRRKMGLKPAAV